MALADVFDALISRRIYKTAFEPHGRPANDRAGIRPPFRSVIVAAFQDCFEELLGGIRERASVVGHNDFSDVHAEVGGDGLIALYRADEMRRMARLCRSPRQACRVHAGMHVIRR